MAEQYPTINQPEYMEKGFGFWWHKCGKQAVEQVIEKGEEDE